MIIAFICSGFELNFLLLL